MAEPIFGAGPGSKVTSGPQRILVGMKLEGVDALRETLRQFSGKAIAELSGAMRRFAERMITQAKLRTPVDTGNLRASGHVQPPVVQGSGILVTLGFGGPAGIGNVGGTNRREVGYAVIVHENVRASHRKRLSKKKRALLGVEFGESGQAKYLESVLLENAPTMEFTLAQDLGLKLQRLAERAARRRRGG